MKSTYIHKCEFHVRDLWLDKTSWNQLSKFVSKSMQWDFSKFLANCSLSALCILAHSSKISGFTMVEWDMMQRVHHISFHYLAQDSIPTEMNHTFNGIFNVLKLFFGLCTSHECSHLVWIQLQCFSAGSLSLLLHNYSAMDQQLILRLESSIQTSFPSRSFNTTTNT